MNHVRRAWRWLDQPVTTRWYWLAFLLIVLVIALDVIRGWW